MGSMTVTATQSGTGAANGTGIAVRVLTGAKPPASQTGGATASGNTTTLNASVTPVAVGSQIYTALISYGGAGSFTWEPAETSLLNEADPLNGRTAGFARLTSLTPSLAAITVGASAGPGPNYHFAVAEVQGTTSSSLIEDLSTPAPTYNPADVTVTSPAFTPPAGALLVAVVVGNTNGSVSSSMAITDSMGLTWTQLVINPGSFPNTGVWVAQVPLTSVATLIQQATGGDVSNYGIGTTDISTTGGNSLVVFAGWEATSYGTAITIPALSVSDSAGNLWKQIGISAPVSPLAQTRGAIWIADNAEKVSWVSVCTTGVSLAFGWVVAEFSGLAQNVALDFSLASNSNVQTSSSLSGFGTGQGVGFSLVVAGANTVTVSSVSSGWTALTRTTQGGTATGVSVMPYWNSGVAAGWNTLSFTLAGGPFFGGSNFNTLYSQLLTSSSPPAQYTPEFPFTMVEAAFGAEPGLVSSSTDFTYSSENVYWEDISSRVFGDPAAAQISASRGKQYELSQAEAGTLSIRLDNHDGAFIPTYPGSPYYSNAINSNMSFQVSISPWNAIGGAVLSLSSVQAYASGLNATAQISALITPDGVTSTPGINDATFYPVNPAYAHSLSAWVYCSAAWASGVAVSIDWYDSSFSSISTSTSSTVVLSAATWTSVSLLGATPPAAAAYASINVFANGTPSSSTLFYIAEAALVTGSVAVRTGQVAVLTPIRVTTWWRGRQYPVWMGYVEQWPQAWPEMPQWGFSTVTAMDAIGVLSAISMNSALVSDILLDNPYAYLPCNEQYTTAIVGSSPQFQFMFGSNPYYSPSDANGLNALNKALGNQINGVYSDGQANTPVNTGVQMNFFGDNSTGVGATSYASALSGHRGPCMLYTDPHLASLTHGDGFVFSFSVEFWFTWNGPVSSSINLLSMYSTPSSFWFTGFGSKSSGLAVLVWIGASGTSNTLNLEVNGSGASGPTVTPSASPQQVVLVFDPNGTLGTDVYLNGQYAFSNVFPTAALDIVAVGLGPATYSYDCANGNTAGFYTSNNYSAGHLAMFPYQLDPERILSHYKTGVTGWSGAPGSVRFAQILTWALSSVKRGGYDTLNATGTAESTQIGPAYALSGSSAAQGVNEVVQSEGGAFYVKADGTATYIERRATYNELNVGTFGDNASANTTVLNANPGFAGSVAGWNAVNGTLVSSGTAYAGSGSGFLTPTGSGGTAAISANPFAVTALKGHTAGAWVLSPNGYGSVQTQLLWLNATGGTITGSTTSPAPVPPNSWTFLTIGSLAAAGAASGIFNVQEVNNPGTANTLYIAYGFVTQDSDEVPVLKGSEYGFDNTYIYNEVTSTQQDGPNTTLTADYRDLPSQGQYFRRSALSFQQNVVSPYDVNDITTWSTNKYKNPVVHLNEVVIGVSENPLIAFPAVLPLDIQDVIQITRRPLGGGQVYAQGKIQHVQVDIGARYWRVTYQISPYAPANYVLCADTTGYDTPGTTTLGW